MYSPKISEELIPKLYRIAKAKKIPMTRLVNQIIEDAIKDIQVESEIIEEKKEVSILKEKFFIK